MNQDKQSEVIELLPCPFCGVPLEIGGGCNPWGRCDTSGCWMHERALAVVLDDPRQVDAWNTRPSLSTPSEGVIEHEARALFEYRVSEDSDNEYCSWEDLPDKETWRWCARAALARLSPLPFGGG